jgi:hypothetical protein
MKVVALNRADTAQVIEGLASCEAKSILESSPALWRS